QGIGLRMHKVASLPDSLEKYKIILQAENGKFRDVTAVAQSLSKQGTYYLFELVHGASSPFTAGFPYVDLLVAGVTDTFLQATMPGYEKYLGKEFGKLVPGIFTDEPNLDHGVPRDAIRWTPELFEVFERDWGYNLVECLPSLAEEVGDWQRVRHNYYRTLLQLFIDRWAKPNHEYCKTKNLQWTGHYWEHDWPSPVYGGDNMAMYAWHQMPGIDMLFNTRTERPDQFGNNRAVRELISVANQMGATRTLSETYGASGYDLTFEDMMRNGNWEFALGVNFMTQHLSYYSIQGTRKYDFPQTFSYHAPYWEQYREQNDYFGRLSLALSSGEQINRILVIEPTTSAWMYFSKSGSNRRFEQIARAFEKFVNELESMHIEYDLGCENIIKDHGRAADGKFVINQRKYDLVIFPPGTDNLDEPTVRLLKQYLEQGGRVISFEQEIRFINGAASEELKKLQDSYRLQWRMASSLSEVEKELIPQGFQVLNPKSCGGELYHQRRIFEDGQLIFFTNFSLDQKSKASVSIEGENLLLLDLIKGEIFTYPAQKNGRNLQFEIEVQPGEGKLFFATDKKYNFKPYKPLPKQATPIKAEEEISIHRLSPNSLMLDFCNVTVNGKTYFDMNHHDAAMEVFRAHGIERGNPWTVAVQFKSTLVDADTFAAESGFEVEYPFAIQQDFDAEKMKGIKLVVEWPHLYRVLVNGNEAKPIPGEWWLSRENGVYAIGDNAKLGQNSIKLICRPMSIFAEIEPVYLIGDFAVKPSAKGFTISNPAPLAIGSWKNLGLPTYPAAVEYTKIYDFDQRYRECWVRLGKWSGTVAEVLVNGKKAGLIYSQPYQLAITDFITEGKNTVSVRVIGSLKNILGPFHQQQTKGLVTPWSWKFPPKQQPAGHDYALVDYGLFEEFEVIAVD
ncbi:MAG: glycosyl hydrolase, partial [candidate division KSB1 bacterium]|nr:glycosyl hydrolase [candidate division KSB1 bacterium]